MILKFDFSGINTNTPEATFKGFLRNVKSGVKEFIYTYKDWFDEKDTAPLGKMEFPEEVLQHLFDLVKQKAPDQKLYVLIDEYDHFSNELLSFNYQHFKEIVGQNGFVRKFYEMLKKGTGDYVVDRLFITGILPVTLDSLTSGFNISTNITTDLRFHNTMGFTEGEVIEILRGIEIEESQIGQMLSDLKTWYDGYLFSPDATIPIYNSDMVWYFAGRFNEQRKYPKNLLDTNISSDYGKVGRMTRIQGKHEQNTAVLKEIIEQPIVTATLTEQFSFDEHKEWTRDDFISLLFYQGILTIEKGGVSRVDFQIPNFVIRQLYFQFFYHLTLWEAGLSAARIRIEDMVEDMAWKNNVQPLIDHTENVLSQLATQDRAHYNELQLKVIFTSIFYQVGFLNIFSELEVRKSKTEKGRVDLLLTRRPPFEPVYQFVFELKYLKKSQAGQLKRVQKEAVGQLKEYLENDDRLKKLDKLKAYVVVFVVNKGMLVEVK